MWSLSGRQKRFPISVTVLCRQFFPVIRNKFRPKLSGLSLSVLYDNLLSQKNISRIAIVTHDEPRSDGLSLRGLTLFLKTTDLWSDGLLLKNYRN